MGYQEKQNSSRLLTQNNVAVATTSTAAASSAFGAQTTQIRVCAPAACFIKISADTTTPTAANTDTYVPPNFPEYFTVNRGGKVSAFSATVQTVSIWECG